MQPMSTGLRVNQNRQLKKRSNYSNNGWMPGETSSLGVWPCPESSVTETKYTIPVGWDTHDFSATKIQYLARRYLLPSAVQYGVEPEALRELMKGIWARYAEVKVKQTIRYPGGFMRLLMREWALRIPELRQPEKDETWSQIWQAGSVTSEK